MKDSYRKKPVIIKAFQMTEEIRKNEELWPDWFREVWENERGMNGCLIYPEEHPSKNEYSRLMIKTLEGTHLVSWGDFIIKGIKGEIYPCKPDIFRESYEPVD
jgi:hypothetical protein